MHYERTIADVTHQCDVLIYFAAFFPTFITLFENKNMSQELANEESRDH